MELKQINNLWYYKAKNGRWIYIQTEVVNYIKELKGAISNALSIKDLWLIPDKPCLPEHESEAKALTMMETTFKKVL